jgi:hypothetical protein
MAVPATAAAAPTARVRATILPPSATHLVKTPAGRRLVVDVPVRYDLKVEGGPTSTASMSVRLTGKAKLASGRTVVAADARRLPGASDRTVEHHLFFTPAATRRLLAAWGEAGTATAAARAEIAISMKASFDVVTEGGGEASGEAQGSGVLPQPTPIAAAEASPDELGHARGSDPCGYYGLANCEDVAGPTWTSRYYLDTTKVEIKCPAGRYPTDKVTDETRSSSYSQAINDDHGTAVVEISDLNLRGHPFSYSFFLACTAEDHEESNF